MHYIFFHVYIFFMYYIISIIFHVYHFSFLKHVCSHHMRKTKNENPKHLQKYFFKFKLQFYFDRKHLLPRLYLLVLSVLLLKWCATQILNKTHINNPSAAYHSTGSIFKCNNDNSETYPSNSIFSGSTASQPHSPMI